MELCIGKCYNKGMFCSSSGNGVSGWDVSLERRQIVDKFYVALNDLQNDDNVCKLKSFRQHRATTRFDHSKNGALCSYNISKKLRLKVDGEALARGAMLHDFFMYDTKSKEVSAYRHGFKHAEVAMRNAMLIYSLSTLEKNIIYSHMWPLNITHLPKSKEAALVCVADKYCAVKEFFGRV